MFYESDPDPYCYPESEVIVNRFDLRDPEILREVESDISALAEAELHHNPVVGSFDMNHLREIHRRLFGDVYAWAGEFRTVRITKGQSVFAYPGNIERCSQELFARLRNDALLHGLPKGRFVRSLAFYMGELNAIHPFREGNGRALRVFFAHLSFEAGYDLRFDEAEAGEMLHASIESFNGNPLPMETLLARIISPRL